MWCRVSRVFATVVFGRCVAGKVYTTTAKQNSHLNFNPLIITPRTSHQHGALVAQIRQGLRCNNCCIGVAGSSSTRARLELT